jgi:aerobic carbon-monoxide dehydrogenase medium subunit
MKPAPFEYHRPETVADVVALLAEHGDEAKPLAGGQSLVPLLALRLARFGHLVDLNRVAELAGVRPDGNGNGDGNGAVVVGAMTRQAAVEHEPVAPPLLARATPLIGHFQIRNRGTVGGSLAHADPASEYPAVAVALGAELQTSRRTIPAADFFVGTWTTALAPDELLVGARFPVWTGRCGFAVDEVARRLGDFALVGAAVAIGLGPDGTTVDRAGIGLFGVGSTPLPAGATAKAVAGRIAADLTAADLDELGHLAVDDLDPPDDVHASGRYRRRAGARLVARALAAALEEASPRA